MSKNPLFSLILISLCFLHGTASSSNDYESISLNTYNNRGYIVQQGSWCRPEIKGFDEVDFNAIFPENNPVNPTVGQITVRYNGGQFSGTGTIINRLPDGRFEGITAKHNFYKAGCLWDTRIANQNSVWITLGQRVNGIHVYDTGTIDIEALIPDPRRDVALFRGTLREAGDIAYVNRITNDLRNTANNLLQDGQDFSMTHHPASTYQQRINNGVLSSTNHETFCFSDHIRDLGYYEMDTLPGSSGAPLFHNDELVGVHISGRKLGGQIFRYTNRDYSVGQGDVNCTELIDANYVNNVLRHLDEEVL